MEVNAQLFDPAVKPETNAQRIAREQVERGNRPATHSQLRYIAGLRTWKDIGTMGEIPADLTITKASEAIEWLKARPARAAYVPEMYAVGLYTHDGRIFRIKVAKHNPNRTYAVELVEGSWEYVRKVDVPRLTKMTIEQAAQYGRKTGQCIECGRQLTNPVSVAAGIGPICAGRF